MLDSVHDPDSHRLKHARPAKREAAGICLHEAGSEPIVGASEHGPREVDAHDPTPATSQPESHDTGADANLENRAGRKWQPSVELGGSIVAAGLASAGLVVAVGDVVESDHVATSSRRVSTYARRVATSSG
jgi:hypothetical protein